VFDSNNLHLAPRDSRPPRASVSRFRVFACSRELSAAIPLSLPKTLRPPCFLLLSLLFPCSASADEALASLVERVAPSVVNIHTQGERQPSSAWDGIFGGPRRWESLGSGFVVDAEEGLVVTNQHVVGRATTMQVMDQQGRVRDAELVGADPDADLALLRVRGLDLPAVTLGSSRELRVGDDVFAVGNPYGHGHTVTRGILSARARSLGRESWDLFLQTDAAINPGSSGGPLFDGQGRVVGVNTAVDQRGESIGFAMPVELVVGALPSLREGQRATPGWAGLRLDERPDGGLVVASVYEGGPAEAAGVRSGDAIETVDGRPVFGRPGWAESFALAFPGERRRLGLVREGKRISSELLLISREVWAAGRVSEPVEVPSLGVSVAALRPDVADSLGVGDAVQVSAAPRGSVFQPGDVVLELNGSKTPDPPAFARAAGQAVASRRIEALILRGGTAIRLSQRW
jgi:serine protease Do